jgi:hypothetical protein
MRRVLCLGLVTALAAPTPAFALREIVVGNEPLHGLSKELLAAFNVPERTILSEGGLDETYDVNFHGGPKALNEAFRHFVAIPADKHEVILMPFAATPFDFGKEKYPYDWTMHVPGPGRDRRLGTTKWNTLTMTVYIPNPGPPAPADPKAARRWIAELGSDDFKTRERAAKELAALGPAAAALYREAMKGKSTPEARDRLERLLADVSQEIRPDTLDIPAGLTVVGPDDLLAAARNKLTDKAGHIRADGANSLADCGVPAEEILPELEKILKDPAERGTDAPWGAAMAACRLGATAKPLLPALKVASGSKVDYVSNMCKQAVAAVEAATNEPVPEAEAKKRAAIRMEIRELVAGRK